MTEEKTEFIQVSPYEIELTTSHVVGETSIKETAIRVSAPSYSHAKKLYKEAVTDALLLRSLGK